MGHIHWADGTLFDLVAIRKKAHSLGAKLIIDGTQSVGALPFSVQEIQPDALICAGYKWLMGPYSIGMAYYADSFNDGQPLEYNWINRLNSEDYSQLVNYQDSYKPKADKYSVGESSNFNLPPVVTTPPSPT
jgi:selenocysteine lyase/cysteine desulfurase